MGNLAKHIAAAMPFPSSIKRMVKGLDVAAVFPFYHTISDFQPKHLAHLYPVKSPREFEEDLDYLLQHFNPVALGDLPMLKEKKGGKPNMVITFDDGLSECYDIVLPILLRKGVPAAFFLNNDFIDNRGLFYRYKVSLLLEKLQTARENQKEEAARLLDCKAGELRTAIRDISYVRREITDNLAAVWGLSFDDYQRLNPVYMSTMQIKRMITKGFEFGAHGTDHPLFSILTTEQAVAEVRQSVDDICHRFSLKYKYFAFPFTDYGVSNETIQALFDRKIIDLGFGTAGLKNDVFENYFQRMPMEFSGISGKNVLKGELVRRLIRKITARNFVKRIPKTHP